MVCDCFFVGWRGRGQVGGSGGSTLVALQARLEESRDPLEGGGRLGCGLVVVDLAGSLTHGREDNGGGSGWWLEAVIRESFAACLKAVWRGRGGT